MIFRLVLIDIYSIFVIGIDLKYSLSYQFIKQIVIIIAKMKQDLTFRD